MRSFNRRSFIRNSAIAATGAIAVPTIITSCKGKTAPSDKLNVAFIGAGGKGKHAIDVLKENALMNIIALADVDDRMAAKTYEMLPRVKHFKDFRKMLEIYAAGIKEKRMARLQISTEKLTPFDTW